MFLGISLKRRKIGHDAVPGAGQITDTLPGDDLQDISIPIGQLGLKGYAGDTANRVFFPDSRSIFSIMMFCAVLSTGSLL